MDVISFNVLCTNIILAKVQPHNCKNVTFTLVQYRIIMNDSIAKGICCEKNKTLYNAF